jgi:hypothetical protein
MDQRREFIRKMIIGAAGFSMLPALTRAGLKASGDIPSKPYSIDNPYEGIDWKNIIYTPSATHVHIEGQSKLDAIYNRFKLRHIPISNYYPSAPYYPADKIRENNFINQNFSVVYNPDNTVKGKEKWTNGKSVPGPIDWNKVIMDPQSGWYNELPENLKERLPIKPGSLLYPNIPKDVIISPNAEHHSFTNSPLHACAVGSLYASGNFDVHNDFKTIDHGYSAGTGLPWEKAFALMLDKLLFKDGGGITINHPIWSGLTFDDVIKMLDFDNRVMGIEVYNDTCATNYGEPEKGWALKLWDEVLKTNRRCLGFFVPDHTVGRGKNILLLPQFTENECLKAYRKGAFFGAMTGETLMFTNIFLAGNLLKVGLNNTAYIRIVTNAGEAQKTRSNEVEFKVPVDSNGIPSVSYIRIEATDDNSEQIFSQPIRFLK